MPTFAPVYRPNPNQQTFLTRQQRRRVLKPDRDGDSSDNEDATHLPSNTAATSFIRPVARTDPYHVAGHPRDQPLPPAPFPHAAVKDVKKSKLPIDEELARLNPPLFLIPHQKDRNSGSLRRRHLDNLTSILHCSMLRGDWDRATHAWSILIRTEISGLGLDVRRNGRWGIPAELLMRRKRTRSSGASSRMTAIAPEVEGNARDDNNEPEESHSDDDFLFSDAGFEQAKEYYERLIVQNPHTPHTQHRFNATQVYPALFNIWIYQVQQRSQSALRRGRRQRRQQKTHMKREASSDNTSQSDLYSVSDTEDSLRENATRINERTRRHEGSREIRSRELNDATAIAQRLEMLCLSPPYDTHVDLLRLSVMVEIWTADLHDLLADTHGLPLNEGFDYGDPSVNQNLDAGDDQEHRVKARDSRVNAKRLCERLRQMGAEIPTAGKALNIEGESFMR